MLNAFIMDWGLPAAGIVIAACAWLYARHSAHDFDQKFGRKGQ
jgi:hypothetical protein